MNNSSKLPIISDLINQINYTVNKMNKSLIFFSTTHQELRFDIENEAAYYVNVDYFYGLFLNDAIFIENLSFKKYYYIIWSTKK